MRGWALLLIAALGLAVVVEQASPGYRGSSRLADAAPAAPPDAFWDGAKRLVPKPKRGAPAKPRRKAKPPKGAAKLVGCVKPNRRPVGIPAKAFKLYMKHAGCDWWVIAGVYFVESNHGTSNAPGVKSGVNRFGCCAGPGQFHLGGTAQRYGLDRRTVYLMEYAVPATVRMLKDNGLGSGRPGKCISTARRYRVPLGTANALWNYNRACWYVAGTLQAGAQYWRQATQ